VNAGAGRPGRERRARGIVLFGMAIPLSLPVLGVAAVMAVIAGLHLGNSAVSEINPIYFQGPAVHPRDRGAAIDEAELRARLVQSRPSYDQLYGWDDGAAARGFDCPDCGAALQDGWIYAAAVPYFGSREERRAEDEIERREIDRRYEERLDDARRESQAGSKEILRYADFPLTEDVAAEPAVEEPLIED